MSWTIAQRSSRATGFHQAISARSSAVGTSVYARSLEPDVLWSGFSRAPPQTQCRPVTPSGGPQRTTCGPSPSGLVTSEVAR